DSGKRSEVGGLARELGSGMPRIAVRDDLARRSFRVHVISIVEGALWLFLERDEIGSARAQIDFAGQRLAHEIALTLERDRSRQAFADELLRIAPFILLEQLGDHVEVSELIAQHPLPDRLDAWIRLRLDAAVVVVDLGRLVQEPILEQRLR